MPVEIKLFPETPIAMLTHCGQHERINETAARFIAGVKRPACHRY